MGKFFDLVNESHGTYRIWKEVKVKKKNLRTAVIMMTW